MNDRRFKRKLEKMQKQGERYKQEAEIIAEYAEYVPERKKRKVSNIMLVVSVIAILAYVATNCVLQYYTGSEISPTITPYWFGFWTSELFLLAGIKVGKVIKHNPEDEFCG